MGQLADKGMGAGINDGMDGVESQPIQMIVDNPVPGALPKILADLITVWAIEV